MTSHEPPGATILRLLRLGLHAGFFALLALATTRVLLTRDTPAHGLAALAGATALAAVYAAGELVRRHRARRAATAWLATVTTLWAALLAASTDYSWLAFPLFFLHMHLLRGKHAVLAVAAVTGLVITAQIAHAGTWTTGMVLGPVLGALFAVIITSAYTALYAENEQRRRLIEDLTRTRAELATSQHQAGIAAERERLAREIHDTLAQGLSSIVLLLRAADTADDPAKTRDRIDEARRVAADNLDEARRFVRDLRPPSLSTAPLPQALQRLCERTERETGTTCRLHLDGHPTALPSHYDVALLRAAQASLANVTRHAAARTAVLTLAYLDTEVTLDIYDDGTGFDPATAHPRPDGTGFGLTGLRERITALGGHLDVESAPGEGTAVAIRLPLTGQETP